MSTASKQKRVQQRYTNKRSACPTGKVRYRDHRQAVDRLHHAQNARRAVTDAEGLGVATTHAAVRSYYCPECRGHHLTSWATESAA